VSPGQRQDPEDRVSYGLRLTLYATCIVVPFITVLTGALDGAGAVAAAMALLGATGGTVALTQARREQTTADAAYRHGVGTGLTTDIGPPGRHTLDEPDERD
jgi:acetyl-CoA carboxylase carboxyltransferase component